MSPGSTKPWVSQILPQLHLDDKWIHFNLVKIYLNGSIADGCSCDQCLQSDNKLEIKAHHHYLINIKLNGFWAQSMPSTNPAELLKQCLEPS